MPHPYQSPLPPLSRRRFLQGLATSSALFMGSSHVAWAGLSAGRVAELSGTQFDLHIRQQAVNFTGQAAVATTVNGGLPAPTLRWREGQTVTIRVTNHLSVDSSIHWHGILLPNQMDGVPGLSYVGIQPGQTFTYRFKVRQSGTYWYHSHSGFQEQTGLYGSIIIDPANAADRIPADRDLVVQLSDWTDDDPMRVFARLKKQSDYYNRIQPTAVDFFRDVAEEGTAKALAKRHMWNRMRMSPVDLADVSGYTYLMNGTPPAGNWTGLFTPGERVRLRFISSGTQSFFDVRIPGLKMTVVHVDGQNIEPVTVDEFRCGPGETYDVIVQPADQAYTVFAQSLGRSGYARGTLAPRAGMQAKVPAMDAPQQLTMADMMGSMMMSGMAGQSATKGKPQHANMAMDHNAMQMDGMAMPDHAHPAPVVHHARSEYGPGVDMRVDTPRTNLDDPGVGLRHNGRQVLTYADIHTLGGPLDERLPERDLELHLTGNMERYIWSLDGLTFGQSTPVHFRHGERLRVILHNDTMMTHPMHLHGMWSELEDADGDFIARRHTIAVQPAQRISFRVSADALGRWAWHCHLLYHMYAGMFREVVVS